MRRKVNTVLVSKNLTDAHFRCWDCSKVFISHSHLQKHILRRHEEQTVMQDHRSSSCAGDQMMIQVAERLNKMLTALECNLASESSLHRRAGDGDRTMFVDEGLDEETIEYEKPVSFSVTQKPFSWCTLSNVRSPMKWSGAPEDRSLLEPLDSGVGASETVRQCWDEKVDVPSSRVETNLASEQSAVEAANDGTRCLRDSYCQTSELEWRNYISRQNKPDMAAGESVEQSTAKDVHKELSLEVVEELIENDISESLLEEVPNENVDCEEYEEQPFDTEDQDYPSEQEEGRSRENQEELCPNDEQENSQLLHTTSTSDYARQATVLPTLIPEIPNTQNESKGHEARSADIHLMPDQIVLEIVENPIQRPVRNVYALENLQEKCSVRLCSARSLENVTSGMSRNDRRRHSLSTVGTTLGVSLSGAALEEPTGQKTANVSAVCLLNESVRIHSGGISPPSRAIICKDNEPDTDELSGDSYEKIMKRIYCKRLEDRSHVGDATKELNYGPFRQLETESCAEPSLSICEESQTKIETEIDREQAPGNEKLMVADGLETSQIKQLIDTLAEDLQRWRHVKRDERFNAKRVQVESRLAKNLDLLGVSPDAEGIDDVTARSIEALMSSVRVNLIKSSPSDFTSLKAAIAEEVDRMVKSRPSYPL